MTSAGFDAPKLGVEYENRTAIQAVYGGDKMAGIIRFPGETDVVNVFSNEGGSYADEEPSTTDPFDYRGEGRNGDQKLARRNRYLDDARRKRRAVRFWYRPLGGPFTFTMWVAVLDRAQVWSLDDDKQLRLEYTFRLMAVPDQDPATWPDRVLKLINDEVIEDEPPPRPMSATEATASKRARTYRDYLTRLGDYPDKDAKPRGADKATRNSYQRSQTAREAVLLRARNRCEYNECTGMPPDTTSDGSAILEVDHVNDLALGGPDHPSQMIALCPNCHAAKTRGKNRNRLRSKLKRIAAERHASELRATAEPNRDS